MALHDTESLVIETATVAESLPDPTLVQGRTHILVNTGFPGAGVWSSIGALPFFENGAAVATISVAVGSMKMVQSDGVRWVVTLIPSAAGALSFPTVTTPVRALNSNFTPHATRPVLGLYSVEIGGVTTLLSGDDGVIELRADAGAPATARASVRNRVFQTLGVTIGTASVVRSELVFLFPPNWQGRLHTIVLVAAPTFAINHATEIIL